MIGNAMFASAVVTLAMLFFLADRLRFLTPYRLLIVNDYKIPIVIALALVFANLTAAFFTASRWFFLKDTGDKLAHFDRELNAGRTSMPPNLHRENLR